MKRKRQGSGNAMQREVRAARKARRVMRRLERVRMKKEGGEKPLSSFSPASEMQ